MIPFRKILFPVDYSEPCRAVAPFVREMTRHFSAELAVVHAYGPEALALSELPINDPELPSDARAREEQRLREFAASTFPGRHVEAFSELGEPGTVIDRIVRRQGTDLVMLPTHGRGPFRRLLLGSVAAKVLHDISAAVWTAVGPALADPARAGSCNSILCALDDSDEAPAVLQAAAALAASYRAQLSLLHVVEIPPSAEVDVNLFREELVAAAETRLRDLKAQLGITAPHSVREGVAPDVVHQEALRSKADLVVVGRGRSQAAFARLWSRLYAIVRDCPCPVLSV